MFALPILLPVLRACFVPHIIALPAETDLVSRAGHEIGEKADAGQADHDGSDLRSIFTLPCWRAARARGSAGVKEGIGRGNRHFAYFGPMDQTYAKMESFSSSNLFLQRAKKSTCTNMVKCYLSVYQAGEDGTFFSVDKCKSSGVHHCYYRESYSGSLFGV